MQKQSTICISINWGGGKNYALELLVVNDGSRDNTAELLPRLRSKYPFFNYLDLSRNFGKENALLAGFDYATGDCVIVMDSDLQHPADAIPRMIEQWEQGYDDVYGMRQSRGSESLIRKKFSLAYYRMLQKSTRVDILPNVGDFRLLDRRVVDAVRHLRESGRNTKGLLAWVGYKKTGIEFETADRINGKSSFNFRSLLNLALDGITGFTTAPLRLAGIAGITFTLLSLLSLITLAILAIFTNARIDGWAVVTASLFLSTGLVLIALGIVGEYIARIFNNSNSRPNYIAESFNGTKI